MHKKTIRSGLSVAPAVLALGVLGVSFAFGQAGADLWQCDCLQPCSGTLNCSNSEICCCYRSAPGSPTFVCTCEDPVTCNQKQEN